MVAPIIFLWFLLFASEMGFVPFLVSLLVIWIIATAMDQTRVKRKGTDANH